MPDEQTRPGWRTICDIKDDILLRASERQASIERGELDLPLQYASLPLAKAMHLVTQLEYRHNFLQLAVPSPGRGLKQWIIFLIKSSFRRILRWLLIRQVEFNGFATEQARECVHLLALSDQGIGELFAVLNVLKLQTNALAERLNRLENKGGAAEGRATAAELRPGASPDESWQRHQFSVDCFRGRGVVLDIGCESGDFVRLLVSHGIPVQGVEENRELAEFCRDRELPVVCANALEYLAGQQDNSVGGIHLGPLVQRLTHAEIDQLLSHCGNKLEKGGVLLLDTPNAQCELVPRDENGPRLAVGFLWVLFQKHGFTPVECIFNTPVSVHVPGVTRTGLPLTTEARHYANVALMARK